MGAQCDTLCDCAKTVDGSTTLELFLNCQRRGGFARRNLVIHRDIKPRRHSGERLREPKLLDFGIAELLAKDEDATQLGSEGRAAT